jgi:hypothetical protein
MHKDWHPALYQLRRDASATRDSVKTRPLRSFTTVRFPVN